MLGVGGCAGAQGGFLVDGAGLELCEHVLTFTLSSGLSGASRDLWSSLPRAKLPGTAGGKDHLFTNSPGKQDTASEAFNPCA